MTTITFDAAMSDPTIKQADGGANTLTIQAQNHNTGFAGNLILQSGSGVSGNGTVYINTGSNTMISITQDLSPTLGYIEFGDGNSCTTHFRTAIEHCVGLSPYSTNYTVDSSASDYFLTINTSAARTITLPTPSAGRTLIFKDKTGSAGTNNITIARHGTEKIENIAASYVLNTNYAKLTLMCDGTDWWVV